MIPSWTLEIQTIPGLLNLQILGKSAIRGIAHTTHPRRRRRREVVENKKEEVESGKEKNSADGDYYPRHLRRREVISNKRREWEKEMEKKKKKEKQRGR
jgi:hypothetical protein